MVVVRLFPKIKLIIKENESMGIVVDDKYSNIWDEKYEHMRWDVEYKSDDPNMLDISLFPKAFDSDMEEEEEYYEDHNIWEKEVEESKNILDKFADDYIREGDYYSWFIPLKKVLIQK